jgi:hypothetical protein
MHDGPSRTLPLHVDLVKESLSRRLVDKLTEDCCGRNANGEDLDLQLVSTAFFAPPCGV